jgi:elongation factor 1-gamma
LSNRITNAFFLQGHGRSIPAVVAAKANGLDLEIVETTGGKTPTDINPLGKIPAFVGANGFKLTEAVAIAIYSMCLLHPHLNFCFLLLVGFLSLYDDFCYPCQKESS